MSHMTDYRFRTAVGGFHKGDVSVYISDTAKKHKQEIDALTKRIDELEEANRLLEEQLSPTDTTEPPEMPAQEAEIEPEYSVLELEAYRRAEAAERLANQRAKKLYMQLETICHDTDTEFDAAAEVITETAKAVMAQAQTIEEACSKLKTHLMASCQQIQSMDSMIPDPAEGQDELI